MYVLRAQRSIFDQWDHHLTERCGYIYFSTKDVVLRVAVVFLHHEGQLFGRDPECLSLGAKRDIPSMIRNLKTTGV